MEIEMAPNVAETDLLIENINLTLLRRIEERARLGGRSIEEEAIVLMERGLALDEAAD
jgi:hypothetical protein